MTTKTDDTIDLGALQREVDLAYVEMVNREEQAEAAETLADQARTRWRRLSRALMAQQPGDGIGRCAK